MPSLLIYKYHFLPDPDLLETVEDSDLVNAAENLDMMNTAQNFDLVDMDQDQLSVQARD